MKARLNDKRKFQSLDIVLAAAQDKLKFQSEQWNSIDQKNAIALAVYGIIMAIFLAGDMRDAFLVCKKLTMGVWLGSIALGMLSSLFSLRPRVIDMPPNIEAIISKLLHSDENNTKK